MATTFLDISAALDSTLNTYASANSVPVAWENSGYAPITGTKFLRPTLLAGGTDSVGLGNTSSDDHLGIYQVDVIAPLNTGKGEAVTTADAVAGAFPKGIITYNGVKVRIRSVSRGSGSRDGAWFIVPVEISYQSYT